MKKMLLNEDIYYMKRAFALARKGAGKVSPNPTVGCVIVKNGKIQSEGYHQHFGGPHAEAIALQKASKRAGGSTVYVTLEPCAHYGKTPPCVDALIQARVKRVVVGMKDPNPLVSGMGIAKLRYKRIRVDVNVLQKEIGKLNEAYIKYITQKIPFVTVKMAMTLDGKIAAYSGDSQWISGEKSRRFVHKLRSQVDAIMIGTRTVMKDDPMLTVRSTISARNPLRVVLDAALKIPLHYNVLNNDAKTLVVTTKYALKRKVKSLCSKGIEVIVAPDKNKRIDLAYLMKVLGRRSVSSVLIEGGGELVASSFKAGIVDKVMFFIAPKIIGGRTAVTPVEGEGIAKIADGINIQNITVKKFDNDFLLEGYVEKSSS